jgi:hypothetical protein
MALLGYILTWTGRARAVAVSGSWTNELGSTLILSDEGHGVVPGTYTTAVDGPTGQPMPLIGSYDVSSPIPIPIGWSVAWTDWGSTTTGAVCSSKTAH